MADESRTEQATPRRRQRARREGDVPRSRELPAALALMTLVLFLWWYPQNWKDDWRDLLERSSHLRRPQRYGGGHAGAQLGGVESLCLGGAQLGPGLAGSPRRQFCPGRICGGPGGSCPQTAAAKSRQQSPKAVFARRAAGTFEVVDSLGFCALHRPGHHGSGLGPDPANVPRGRPAIAGLDAVAHLRNFLEGRLGFHPLVRIRCADLAPQLSSANSA